MNRKLINKKIEKITKIGKAIGRLINKKERRETKTK